MLQVFFPACSLHVCCRDDTGGAHAELSEPLDGDAPRAHNVGNDNGIGTRTAERCTGWVEKTDSVDFQTMLSLFRCSTPTNWRTNADVFLHMSGGSDAPSVRNSYDFDLTNGRSRCSTSRAA